jgi:hypothetical protein
MEYERKMREELKGKNVDSYNDGEGFIVESGSSEVSQEEASESEEEVSDISDSDSSPKKPVKKAKRRDTSSEDSSDSDDASSDSEKPRKRIKMDSGDESLDTGAILQSGRRTRGKKIDWKSLPDWKNIEDDSD